MDNYEYIDQWELQRKVLDAATATIGKKSLNSISHKQMLDAIKHSIKTSEYDTSHFSCTIKNDVIFPDKLEIVPDNLFSYLLLNGIYTDAKKLGNSDEFEGPGGTYYFANGHGWFVDEYTPAEYEDEYRSYGRNE